MSIIAASPADLRDRRFEFVQAPDPSGRVEIFESPTHGHEYVIGFDAAYGVGRDYDTVCVLNRTLQERGSPAYQVAEAEGHWGPNFHSVVYALHVYYNRCYILGERQVGHFTLAWLWQHYGVRNMYREGALGTVVEGVGAANSKLGWHKAGNDRALAEFRQAVATRRVCLRSSRLVEQMGRLQWKPPSSEARTGEREADEAMKVHLRGGGSPDLVMAATYAWFALSQVHTAPIQVAETFAPGTYGEAFGYDQDDMPDRGPRGVSFLGRRR